MIQMIQMHIYQKFFCVCTLQHRKKKPVDVSFLAPLMLFMLRTIGLTVLVLLRGQSCCHGCHILNTDNRPYMPSSIAFGDGSPPEKHRGNNIHAVQKLRKNYCTSFEKTKRPREHPQNQATFSES